LIVAEIGIAGIQCSAVSCTVRRLGPLLKSPKQFHIGLGQQ